MKALIKALKRLTSLHLLNPEDAVRQTRRRPAVWLGLAAALVAGGAQAAASVHHELRVSLDPARHRLAVEDIVTLPAEAMNGGTARFVLHSGLQPETTTAGASLRPLGIARAEPGEPAAAHYLLTLPAGVRQATLRYAGEIYHPLAAQPGDEARGASDTPGTISEDGVFLGASSLWFPQFDGGLVSFSLDVTLPGGWTAVSQGSGTDEQADAAYHRVRWSEDHPQPGIYLLAGRYSEYTRPSGTVDALAFLLEADPELAKQYLDTTVTYIDFFSRLLGNYPYRKFAVVENFWETGYGMPSFTAMGRTVMRLPFILQSSYPHEILHNWWGNGVYVDLAHGNWSEGLTAYLADHLIAERNGEGATMRRNNLQRYVDYVHEAGDFSLTAFRERHSPATEAVGYGKAMMFFHMLRRELGDARFIAGLRDFYREELFQMADFEDLRRALARHADSDLRTEFEQWITRSGAPALRVGEVRARPLADGRFELDFMLRQTQSGPPYQLHVPVAVTLEGQARAYETEVTLSRGRERIKLPLDARPVRLEVDPQFDLFRRLDRMEVPPALSQVFGAERVTLVVPAAAPPTLQQAYRALAEGWREGRSRSEFQVVADTELRTLPRDRAVWLFGWENRLLPALRAALPPGVTIGEDGLHLPHEQLARDGQALALTARHAERADLALGWLASDDAGAVANVGRKLPHYGQYSYVAFSGQAATNVAKGQWAVTDSPLSVAVRQADGRVIEAPAASLAQRTALAP